jgi:hypothetical protein
MSYFKKVPLFLWLSQDRAKSKEFSVLIKLYLQQQVSLIQTQMCGEKRLQRSHKPERLYRSLVQISLSKGRVPSITNLYFLAGGRISKCSRGLVSG